MSAELIGAKLRRVDAPWPDLLALSLGNRTLRGVLLIGLGPAARGIGWTDARPRGNASSPLLLRARSCLEGGRVVELRRPTPDRLVVVVERAGVRHALDALLRGSRGNAWLRTADGEVLAALHAHDAGPAPQAETNAGNAALEPLAALRAEGERMLEALGVSAIERQKLALARALRAAERRLERRLAAIEQDRARVERVHELRRNAGLLLTHLHELAPDVAGAVTLDDQSVDPPARVDVEIDRALGPRRQAEAWFHAARKLERGAAIAEGRARATRQEIDELRALSARAGAALEASQLLDIAEQARARGVPVDPGAEPGRRKAPRTRLPYRQFTGSGGRAILVGKGAEDNDKLTLEHARPHDLWLHARDDAGAHVVIPLDRGAVCPSELLCDAATLAAHFSQARGQARVDVLYTERRYVRKPRRVGAGKVVLMREKVFRLQLQAERLKRLLAAERPAT